VVSEEAEEVATEVGQAASKVAAQQQLPASIALRHHVAEGKEIEAEDEVEVEVCVTSSFIYRLRC
jgi:hypothetical protein